LHDRVTSYLFLCQALTNPADAWRRALDDPPDWDTVLELAEEEMVLPALGVSARAARVPAAGPAASRLERAARFGALRNARIRDQAGEAIAAINQVGVVPLLLKGGLRLYQPGDLAGRFLRDVDLVVRPESFDAALAALRTLGYRPDDEVEGWTYHFRPLHHRDRLVPIELHVQIGEQRTFLPPEEAWESAEPVPHDGLEMLALSPTHRVAHNVFHSEIMDRGHSLALVWLRQLLDLADLMRSYPASIDWPWVATRMGSVGGRAALEARLWLAERLLGATAPGIRDPVLGERHLRRCMRRVRRPALRRLALTWAGSTQSFKRHHIDLVYRSGPGALELNVGRGRQAWRLARKHGWGLWSLAWRRGRAFR
jgi:hypothetical protein